MKISYIDKEGVKARIHEWGCNQNPTIICLHGLGSTSLSFIELGELLQSKYHVVAFDLPGHGKTPAFEKEEDYKMDRMVKWMDKLLANITTERFFILAHSWGADIALHYTSLYPLKVKKALFLDGGYYIKSEKYTFEASRNGSIDSLQKELDYYYKDFDDYCFDSIEEHIEVEKSNYSRWSSLLEAASKDLVVENSGRFRYHAKGFTAASAIKAMFLSPPDSVYNKLLVPTYLLQSTLPESMDEIRTTLAKKFEHATNSKVKKIAGAGHMLHWDKPNEVVHEILSWF